MMFLQSVFVLLVAIQVTSSCGNCPELSLELAMCPNKGKTVVVGSVGGMQLLDAAGNVVDEEATAVNIKYNMAREVIFKEGPNRLSVKGFTFHMILPLDNELCPHRFLFDGYDDLYFITGDVDTDGILHSTMCQLVLSTPSIKYNEDLMDVLFGSSAPNCGRADSLWGI